MKAEKSGKDKELPFYRKGINADKIKDHRVIQARRLPQLIKVRGSSNQFEFSVPSLGAHKQEESHPIDHSWKSKRQVHEP